jgi:ComF family protein
MNSYLDDFISLLYPRTCPACGNPLFKHEEVLCTYCLYHLPQTNFHMQEGNPVEQLFWGRAELNHACAIYFFQKGGKVQRLVHQFKYKGYKEIGIFLGKMYGSQLLQSPLYEGIQKVIPVPLHNSKKRKRGYNQSEQFAIGLAKSLNVEMDARSFIRIKATETQTRKTRFARWENVKEIFSVKDPEKFENQHLLLVDDIITTGATIEACAYELLRIPGVSLSVASIGYAV